MLNKLALALDELDAANNSKNGYRQLDGKRHYIQVTHEIERAAREQGKKPLLWSQYELLNSEPVSAWDAFVIEAKSLRSDDGSYTNTGPLEALLELLPRRQISQAQTA